MLSSLIRAIPDIHDYQLTADRLLNIMCARIHLIGRSIMYLVYDWFRAGRGRSLSGDVLSSGVLIGCLLLPRVSGI